jgi:8-oxo-dGTP pyrophosphatase MutT (NUDIX family)
MKNAACVVMMNRVRQTLRVVNRHGSSIKALPGGKQDPGETIRETAIRETMEECGIDISQVVSQTPFFEAICPGGPDGVDYFVSCFMAMPVTDARSSGIEPDIVSEMVPIAEFKANNAFPIYNAAMFAALEKM